MLSPKNVAAFCQSCQKLIAVVPVRRLDRVYVPLCPYCKPPVDVVDMYETDGEWYGCQVYP